MDTFNVIKLAQSSIESKLTSWINIDEYGYLLGDMILDKNSSYKIDSNNFQWDQISELNKRTDDWWTYFVTFQLNFEGIVVIQQHDIILNTPKKNFELFIDLWFKTDKIQITYRILDKSYKTIKDYIQHIESYNEKNAIYSLIDEQVHFGNKNFISFATDITRKHRTVQFNINDFVVIDDIARISQDLQCLLGEISQLKPYLENYILNSQYLEGKVYYNYQSNFIDKRYFFLIGVIFEIFYNYWDKIGDLLAIYFPPNLNSDRIIFTSVIDSISEPYKKSLHYLWLKDFRDTKYKKLNEFRKQVVHYKNIESKFHEIYMSKFDSKEELEKLQSEKLALMDLIKDHYQNTILGFEKTFLLIDEII